MELQKPLDQCSLEELYAMRNEVNGILAAILCKLIRDEIRVDGTKKHVKTWRKSLENVAHDIQDNRGIDESEAAKFMVEEVRDVLSEALTFLVAPKREG